MARSQHGRSRPGRLPPVLSIFVLFIHALIIFPALAIQVTPNSPCAKLCIDSAALDVSDPASSTTVNADITCDDADFNTTTAGTKWVSCMTCLQTSTFAQGAESDQSWFFYNLRYQVDLCIFGYPNASDIVGSSPCQTSTACLPLQDALFTGVPTVGNGSEYDYCSVDGGVVTSDSLKGCLNCISGSGSSSIIANSLIALEAGCVEQRPPSESVGLSGSLFATGTTVSIETTTSSAGSSASGASGSKTSHVAVTTIVVVAVVAVLVVAAIVGFGFVCYRKRRNPKSRPAAQRSPLELKADALTSMESGVGKPGQGGQGGPGNGPVGGRKTGNIGPVDWHTRFPSTEHISGPLHFHSPSSAVSAVTAEDMFNRSAAGISKAAASPNPNDSLGPPASAYIGAGISRPSSCSSAHSSVVSSMHMHEQPVGAGASPATRKYKQQFQQTHAGSADSSTDSNSTTVSPSSKSHGSGNGNGSLPAIVESPFPSPAAVVAGPGSHAVGSLSMRIHSTDFDKQTGYPMASLPVPARNMSNIANKQKQSSRSRSSRSHPRLHQLKTDFDSGDSVNASANANANINTASTASTATTYNATPSSATGLLSHAVGPGASSTSSASHTYSYNPAMYTTSTSPYHHSPSPMRNEPHSAVSAVSAMSAVSAASVAPSPTSATAGGSIEHQLRVAMRSLPAQQQVAKQQQYEQQQCQLQLQQQKQQQYQQQQAEYAQKLAAANIAHNARKQGGYKGWPSMVNAHQQQQQHQTQDPVHSQSQSQHTSVYGGNYGYGSPASALATSVSASASSRPGSVNGIGAHTMATRQAQAGSPLVAAASASAAASAGAGDVSATSTTAPASILNGTSRTTPAAGRAGSDSLGLGIDNGLPGSAHQVQARKSKSGPFYSLGRGGNGSGSEGPSPVETRSIKTQFAPPPQHGRR